MVDQPGVFEEAGAWQLVCCSVGECGEREQVRREKQEQKQQRRERDERKSRFSSSS